jgi:hypothetical protein
MSTPFMFAMAHLLSRLITVPNNAILKKPFPEDRREVFYTFVTYFAVLVLLSGIVLAFEGRRFLCCGPDRFLSNQPSGRLADGRGERR